MADLHGATEAPRYDGAMAEREGTTGLPAAVAPAARRWAGLLDLVLVLACAAPTIGRPLAGGRAPSLIELLTVLVTTALIVVRRRLPIPVFAVGAAATVVLTTASHEPSGLLPTLIVLLYTAAVTVDRRRAIALGATALAVMVTCVAVLVRHRFPGPEALAALAWPALAVAAADAVRSRRVAIDAAEERARRAEQTREDEARRRVVDERLRIARELHDVVAHHMAVVNVQAGVAAHLLRSRPDAAEEALAVVRSSAGTVLDELSGILNVLRAPDDDAGTVEPTPRLDELPDLVRSFAAAGLAVDVTTSGPPNELPVTVQLAIYRTVQEALTNAHKYGDGAATLALVHGPAGVDVCVTNRIAPTAPAAPAGTGFGLLGMRERVAAAGGLLSVGPGPDGHYEVHATFLARA